MWDNLLTNLAGVHSVVRDQDKGIAFLRALRDLYNFHEVAYVALNIPNRSHGSYFMHCTYSTTRVKEIASRHRLPDDFIKKLDLGTSADDDVNLGSGPPTLTDAVTQKYRLRVMQDEVAGFSVTASEFSKNKQIDCEIKALANYFHSHMLRLNGHKASEQLLVSARELDCLRWTAAGKTAWEASIILGISERTVRFHLNSAREKLKCVTTTQAVASAVARNLISV